MVEQRALGPAGRPGRVEDRGRTLGRERRHGRLSRTRQVVEQNNPSSEGFDNRSPRLVRDDQRRLRVAKDVLGLGGVVVRIHQHDASARALNAEVRRDPVERVGREQRDAVP